MEPGLVVDKIIDIVSKNGNMLLNIPIRADGTLDETATNVLIKVGEWFDVNGEGIYGTRPWYLYGEGKKEIGAHDLKSELTSREIRYTTKGDVLYAFVMGAPRRNMPVILTYLTELNAKVGKVKSVELLGHDGDLQWEMHGDGLTVRLPQKLPSEYAHGLKIKFKGGIR
jgi:alpha-L-fucosidase